jgi:hypothetical protein
MITRNRTALTAIAMACACAPSGAETLHTFKKITVTRDFYCEGVSCGDFNKDGSMDLVAGPFWYAGPDFKNRQEFRPAPAKPLDPKGYSDNFISFTCDFNSDGWLDILEIGLPGEPGYWYENPKGTGSRWTRRPIFDIVDNESPCFGDLTGDGKPELIFNSGGFLGYATPNWEHPEQKWTFHPLSPKGPWHKYTHGLGVGDISGDGRADYVEVGGWWEQPVSLAGDPVWKLHPHNFGEGAAQMLVYDVNGDGLADVVTCLHPHKYGLAWFEQTRKDGEIAFVKHPIMGDKNEDNRYGVKMTQMHAFDKADMDGDGRMDFVTGKRFWAHAPPTDPESDAPAMLYWFKLARGGEGEAVDFIPHPIDMDSGVGTQVVVADMNGDKLPDVIVGNKKGAFVFIHESKEVSHEEWEQAQPKPISK